MRPGTVVIAMLLVIGGMGYARDHHLVEVDQASLTHLVSGVIGPVTAATKQANDAFCASERISAGAKTCSSVLMTPQELKDYEAAHN